MRPLFIDIDGVFNTPMTWFVNDGKTPFIKNYNHKSFDQTSLKAIQKACKILNLTPVLSSTWGYNISPQELCQLGATMGLTFHSVIDDDLRTSRSAMIEKWLNEHPEVTKYAILDDEDGFYTGTNMYSKLVHIDECKGITFNDIIKLFNIFDCDLFSEIRKHRKV